MTAIALVCLWACAAAALMSAVAAVVDHSISMRIARATATVMAFSSTVSTAVLARSLWTLDLSLTYVADHARAGISGPYRLAGLWGGANGSLLMFTSMVAVAVAVLVWTQQHATARSAALWGSLTVAVLTGAVLATANPFRRLAIPAIEGAGMQPILEHPAMLYHPPLLYLGQVSAIVPFLIAGATPLSPGHRRALRGWLGVTLALMTAGLATGSNWAYVELGWGGYWGWDPVENGFLVAWLLCLAALHALGQPYGDRVVRLLCALPWILVLTAASVTRAGIGGSIHAFADDERVAWILLGLLVVTMAAAGTRAAQTPLGRQRGRTHHRERRQLMRRSDNSSAGAAGSERSGQPDPKRRYWWLRIICAALAAVAAVVVLIGVLYPIPALGEPLVTGRYYAPLLAPLAILGLCTAAAVVSERTTVWSATGALVGVITAATAGTHSLFALCVAAGVGVVCVNFTHGLLQRERYSLMCMGSRRLGQDSASKRSQGRGRWSMRIGHIGFTVLLVGVAGSTQAEQVTVGLEVGEEIHMGSRSLRHGGVKVTGEPATGSDAVIATVEIHENDRLVATLHPALVAFPDRGVILAETALHSRPSRDIQVVLRNAVDSGAALYDMSVTPLVMWVWWGSVLMIGAGIMVACDAMTGRAHNTARRALRFCASRRTRLPPDRRM